MTHSSDLSGNPFATVDLDGRGDVDLSALHALVLSRHGRIELTRDGASCVLISKAELETLEQALEILSNTSMVRAMREELAKVARIDTPRAAMPTAPSAFEARARSMNLP